MIQYVFMQVDRLLQMFQQRFDAKRSEVDDIAISGNVLETILTNRKIQFYVQMEADM